MKKLMRILKNLLIKNKLIIIGIIIIIIIASSIFNWYEQFNNKSFVKIEPIKKVRKIKTKKIPIKKVEVLNKKEIVKVLKTLPDDIKNNDNKQITITGEVKPYKGVTEVVNVIDTSTGKSELLISKKKLPFIEFVNDKEIGVRMGFKGNVDVYGKWDFLRIGDIRFSIYGEYDTKKHDYKIMLQSAYKF